MRMGSNAIISEFSHVLKRTGTHIFAVKGAKDNA